MKKIFFLCLSFIFIFCGCSNPLFVKADPSVDMTPRLITSSNYKSAVEVVDSVKSAVVGISAAVNGGYSVGSGVAIADGGYILTNHHVVEGSSNLTVYFADKTNASAKFIWSDSSLDMAIIKSSKNMPYLECGSSKDLQVGEDVLAIGTPLTLQFKHTVTKGIVSALNRTLEIESMGGASYLQNLIQHDASINPGNSGGPLISLDGRVVGINTLKASESEGIGFAIPIEVGCAISERIVKNNDFEPAYIGVFGFDADIANYYGETTSEKGVYVVSVDPKAVASLAGVEEGDLIVKIGDKQIETLLDLKMQMFSYDIGDEIVVEIIRNGEKQTISMVAQERPNLVS